MIGAAALVALAVSVAQLQAADPLPSWNDGPAKKAILEFVSRVTQERGKDFVPNAERLAVFDNDGTLWCEQPQYVQLTFALDRVKALADQHPNWKDKQPFKAVLENDLPALVASGEKGLLELMLATHAGMTTGEFEQVVRDWIATARHSKFQRPYTECVYQPMLERLAYLRASGFKTYIVSGGGVEFMRPWAEKVYGIPPEQIIGSTTKTKYEEHDGQPRLVRLPEIDFIDDKAGKPVAIGKFIGRRPILAAGNSDGDYEMLRYVTAGDGPRLGLIGHHTDAQREYAYDRQSRVGRLDRALDASPLRGWLLVDIKRDWNRIFPESKGASQ
jgi:phosphoglycolate phosphatase-like HAD superfamily hydrolase